MFSHQDFWFLAGKHWPIWFVTVALIVAAAIDGWKLKVPNWLTFPFIVSGWIYSGVAFGWEGLGYSLLGTLAGLAMLLPLYAIGGMGAGDVKLLAGVGAWVWTTTTAYSFGLSAIIGGIIAVGMVLWKSGWEKHQNQFLMIVSEIATIRQPEQLAAIAAQRKSSMLLLPYGIPIAIGTILYFALSGMLI
ncbi:MAG TPA: A24 family peptidase [Pirellulales bacterium]|nr:A24 family peptidase [Pirellulales bacterium]